MSTPVPAGATRSPDGYHWWDGNEWQPVPNDDPQHPSNVAAGGSASTAPAASPAPAAGGAEPAGAASGDPLEDEQVKQALTHDYNEIVAYGDAAGAEVSTEPEESQNG